MDCQKRALGRNVPVRELTLLALFLLLPAAAPAHDTWLVPRSPSARPAEPVTLDLTSGMKFPALESAIQPDRIAQASIRCGGKDVEIRERKATRKSLRLVAEAPGTGIATIWADTKPREIELEPEQVREYLEEIGASETAGREWEKSASKRWREIYTKHAKTFVRVGEPGGDRSWAEPVGVTLEIVPERDPTALVVGDDFTVRVLLDGRPLPDFPVGFAAADQKTGTTRKTDAGGRASIRLDRPGWWLVKGTHLERSTKPDADWVSHFTTVTVKVGPGK
jgi:uncharacterized GH25 family protein